MKKILALVLVLALALTLAACGGNGASSSTPAAGGSSAAGSSTPASEPAGEMDVVNVAYMANYASLVEVCTAMEKGYFADENIEVKLTAFQDGPTIIAAMESGSIDIGYIGSGAHKLAINGQCKIFCFAHVGNGDAVMGLKSKGVETAADLKGKTIGYAPGTSSETILKQVLADAGLSESDVNLMSMDADGIVTAMIGDSLDAAALWSPSTLKVEEELGDDVVTLADNLTYADQAASISSWIVMPSYAETNHDLLVRFTRALYKAKDYRADMSNADEISGYIATLTGLDKDTVYAQRGDAEWLTSEEMLAQIEDGTLAAMYQTQQNGFIATGDVAAEVPLEDYILWDVMEEAGA